MKYILFLFLSALFLLQRAHSTELQLLNKKILFQGESSLHGKYAGQLELRQNGNGIQVVREHTYDQFTFENLTIQEIWTGSAVFDQKENDYVITYTLREGDFLRSAEGETRSFDSFKSTINIVERIHADAFFTTESVQRKNETFTESFLEVRALDAKPLWENKRARVESTSHESSTLLHIITDILEFKINRWYHDQPYPKSFENRDDYKNKKQYMVYDFTDYDFYKSNKNILRVINKTPDKISLVEEIQRRNAFAFSLAEKSDHFQEDMSRYHVNEAGLFSGAEFNSKGKFNKYTLDGDGSLWTGMYLGAMAMKYKVTKDEATLEQVKKTLKGLMLLMDVTGNKEEFARSAVAYKDESSLGEKLHRGTGDYSNVVWLEGGNNDMFKGIIHGFIWAYNILPDSEQKLRNELLEHMKRLPDLSIAKKIQNKALAFGLRALATGDKEDKKEFRNAFLKDYRGESILNIEGTVHVGGIADWSGINLGMVSILSELLVADALGEKDLVRSAQSEIVKLWKDMAGTKRDFLTIAAYTFAIHNGFDVKDANELNDGYKKKDLEQLWQKEFSNATTSLKEIPVNRSKYDTFYNYSFRPDWTLSWWPRLPWKSFKDKQPVEYHYQGVDSYPLFEGLGLGSNFVWKDQAFGYIGGSSKLNKAAGADFLYSYWMARTGDIISEEQ
jgi:translation elongation factor EF-1beta